MQFNSRISQPWDGAAVTFIRESWRGFMSFCAILRNMNDCLKIFLTHLECPECGESFIENSQCRVAGSGPKAVS
jgi:hypothetical protein